MHAEHDIVVANLSCLSVCHTLVLYRNECTYVKRFPPSGRGMTSFLEACHAYRIPRVTLSAGGITYAEVGKICNFYCATHICIVWSLLLKDGWMSHSSIMSLTAKDIVKLFSQPCSPTTMVL